MTLSVWQNETTDSITSSESKSASRRRKLSSGQYRAVNGPPVFPPGSDLSLLAKSPKEGGIVYEIHPRFVPQAVARCRMRTLIATLKSQACSATLLSRTTSVTSAQHTTCPARQSPPASWLFLEFFGAAISTRPKSIINERRRWLQNCSGRLKILP